MKHHYQTNKAIRPLAPWAQSRWIATTLLGAVFALGLFATSALAEPYIAIREGYKCSQCHFNKTGGGKRNDFANTYVQTRLASEVVQWQPEAERVETAVPNIYHGRLNDFFSVGADMRFAYKHVEVPNAESAETDMSTESALIYFQMDMVPDRASLYLDQTVKGAANTREMFMLFDNLPLSSYVKVGKFFLVSGFRLQDDTAFVRAKSGFTYGNPDDGIEMGIEPGPLSFQLWQTSKNDKGGIMGQYVSRFWRAGGSYNRDTTDDNNKKNVMNYFAGGHMGRFTLLYEVDKIGYQDVANRKLVDQEAGLLEGNMMIRKGHNLKLSYEWFDENLDSAADSPDIVSRTSIVYEPFMNQFLQVRTGYRMYEGQSNNDLENRTEMFAELHGIFY